MNFLIIDDVVDAHFTKICDSALKHAGLAIKSSIDIVGQRIQQDTNNYQRQMDAHDKKEKELTLKVEALIKQLEAHGIVVGVTTE
jgi:hypothetical protein